MFVPDFYTSKISIFDQCFSDAPLRRICQNTKNRNMKYSLFAYLTLERKKRPIRLHRKFKTDVIARRSIVTSMDTIAKNNFQSFKVEIGYFKDSVCIYILYTYTRILGKNINPVHDSRTRYSLSQNPLRSVEVTWRDAAH